MSNSSFFMETSSSCKPFMRSWSASKEDEDAIICAREGGGGVKMKGCKCVFVIENSAFKLRTFCPLKNVHF